MPSGYLHQLCAERACGMAGITPVEGDALCLGAQGPDPLFVLGMFPLRLSSRPSKVGALIHQHRTGAFLCALADRAKRGTAVERAFTMGVITHYALDSTVHPYVYSQSLDRHGRYSSALHMRLEKRWDALYYRRAGHRGTPVVMPGLEESRPHWETIADLWTGAMEWVFPDYPFERGMVLRAFADAARVNRLTHSPLGGKYALVWVLERIIGKPCLVTSQMAPRFPLHGDIENTAHHAWLSPYDPERERSEDLATLFDRGVRRAAELLHALSAYFDGECSAEALALVTGNAGYDSGMPSKP